MSQAHLSLHKQNNACSLCFRLKAKWDHHHLCLKCRPCSKDNTCSICDNWPDTLWNRIKRAHRETARKMATSHMDTSASHEEEEKDQDDVQVSIARQQAIIDTMRGQLDQMAAKKAKPKKHSQGGKALASATVTSADQVDKGEHFDLNPSDDEFKDALSSDLDKDPSSSDDPSQDEEENEGLDNPHDQSPLIMTDDHIHIMTHKGIVRVPYAKESGALSIAFPDRLQLVAKLCDIKTTKTRASSPMPDFGYVSSKKADNEPSTLLLPLDPAVEKTVSAFIKPLVNSTSTRSAIFNRPRKPSTLCMTPNDFGVPPVPARAFNRLCHSEVVPDLPVSLNDPKLYPLQAGDLDRASRDSLAAISFIHHSGQAIYQLCQYITHPRQDLKGLHACINAILDMQGSANKTVLQQTAYVQHWITLTRRDTYLSALHKDVSVSTKRALRCSPWSSGSLFGDKEDTWADEFEKSAKSLPRQSPPRGSKRPNNNPRHRDRKRGRGANATTQRTSTFSNKQLNVTAVQEKPPQQQPFRAPRDQPSGSRRGGRTSRK